MSLINFHKFIIGNKKMSFI